MDNTNHRNSVEFMVYGKYALFTDVLTRTGGEKFTYMIPTYGALKGILEGVYWKPTIIWKIDAIRVMKPIQTTRKGILLRPYNGKTGKSDRAYYTYLNDVCYQVRAHFEWNMNHANLESDRDENKHHNIAKRMIERGGRRDIFLGTRECQAYVEPCVFGTGEGAYDNIDEVSFGLMFHSLIFAEEAETEEDKGMLTVGLWAPVMKKGVIEFLPPKDCPFKRHIKKMEIKKFGQKYNNFSGLNEFESDLTGDDDFELGSRAV